MLKDNFPSERDRQALEGLSSEIPTLSIDRNHQVFNQASQLLIRGILFVVKLLDFFDEPLNLLKFHRD